MVSSYIAWYLFLAGAGGGAFLLGSFVDFALRVSNRSCARASAVTDAGLLAGPVLVALGTVFLTLDLGADQAFRLFLTPSGSLLSAGAWALALFCATAFAAFLMGFADDGPGLRVAETVVSVFAALLALFVVLYAGVFLSLYPAVPFLNSPLVPIVFVASALATGAAVLTIIGFFRFRAMKRSGFR
ncbi:MAG: NrfD/PsrC family molybdoenzyme membrane anchor subunit [Adlercreutzia sp.]